MLVSGGRGSESELLGRWRRLDGAMAMRAGVLSRYTYLTTARFISELSTDSI